ncbi:MAG: hypothetical protein WBD36_02215 [Bacteroidota bacterium]
MLFPCVGGKIRSALLLGSIWISAVFAQEGTWGLSGLAGIGYPNLGTVNETLDRTIDYWNNAEGIPIGPFEHFGVSGQWSGKLQYRYERDFAFSLSVTEFHRTIRNSYADADYTLEFERTVGATDVMLGFSYYLPPLLRSVDTYVLVEIGETFARADAYTYSTKSRKVGADYVWDVLYDTRARYRKEKLSLTTGLGADVEIAGPFVLEMALRYKLAKVGQMDGDIQRITGTFPEPSVTEFDFSSVTLMVGLGIRF